MVFKKGFEVLEETTFGRITVKSQATQTKYSIYECGLYEGKRTYELVDETRDFDVIVMHNNGVCTDRFNNQDFYATANKLKAVLYGYDEYIYRTQILIK